MVSQKLQYLFGHLIAKLMPCALIFIRERNFARELQFLTSSLHLARHEVKFCNRTMHVGIKTEMHNKTEVIGVSLYCNDPQNDGLTVEWTDVEYNTTAAFLLLARG